MTRFTAFKTLSKNENNNNETSIPPTMGTGAFRKSGLFLGIFLCTTLCHTPPAKADYGNHWRQKIFEIDKATALANFNNTQVNACMKAFDQRYQAKYILTSPLAFDESMSQITYDLIFWKGEGSLHRGLVFSASVKNQSGADAGNMICYYATTDDKLDFQSAYLLPLPIRQNATISSDKNTIQASLTISSMEVGVK